MIHQAITYMEVNRGLSSNTINAYRKNLRSFVTFMHATYPTARWSTITKTVIDSYVTYLAESGKKAATIKQHIAALRTLYKTMQAMGADIENPAQLVSTPKKGETLPKLIETEAIQKALDSPTTSLEAKAAIAILFETGIRLQELLDLRRNDIDNKTRSIKIHGKGNKERTVYYGELTKKYGRYWKVREIDQRTARHMIYDALKPYSAAQQLSPHALRHTFATEMVNNGMPLNEVQQLLGHKHITTTEIYTHVNNTKIADNYTRHAPRF